MWCASPEQATWNSWRAEEGYYACPASLPPDPLTLIFCREPPFPLWAPHGLDGLALPQLCFGDGHGTLAWPIKVSPSPQNSDWFRNVSGQSSDTQSCTFMGNNRKEPWSCVSRSSLPLHGKALSESEARTEGGSAGRGSWGSPSHPRSSFAHLQGEQHGPRGFT